MEHCLFAKHFSMGNRKSSTPLSASGKPCNQYSPIVFHLLDQEVAGIFTRSICALLLIWTSSN